ncbi:MAG: gluconate 2-dehydrogenase subunit 3 family protein [Pelagibaca sp.]
MPQFSRRAVLTQIGATGLVAALPRNAVAQNAYAELDDVPWFFLTDTEARFLAAFCDVLIPEDDFPSASQAGVVDFIDLQLAAGYGNGAGLYMKGPFREGTPEQGYQAEMVPAELIRNFIAGALEQGQDLAIFDSDRRETVVREFSETAQTVGNTDAQMVFEEIWALTKEGYFGDPLYGGNRDYAGWQMVGFPGAHAYYTEFVGKNMQFDAPPKGIGHIPGTNRSASMGASAINRKGG